MHGAAYKNIPAVVQYLDSVGHDIGVWNTLNRNKRTPLLIAEGYRPGNFKPCFRTVEAITRVMISHGIKPATGPKPKHTPDTTSAWPSEEFHCCLQFDLAVLKSRP